MAAIAVLPALFAASMVIPRGLARSAVGFGTFGPADQKLGNEFLGDIGRTAITVTGSILGFLCAHHQGV